MSRHFSFPEGTGQEMQVVCDKCGFMQYYDIYFRNSSPPKPWVSAEIKQAQGYYLRQDFCKDCQSDILPPLSAC